MTEFNKFVQTEVARLKQERPDMVHKDRCDAVSDMWALRRVLISVRIVGLRRSSRTGTV